MTQAPQTTEDRLAAVEQALASLTAEIQAYREMVARASKHPMTRTLLANLGIRLPKEPSG